MSKSKKAGAASPDIQDISHEEVKPSANGVSIIPKVITAEDQLKVEISKFSIADAGIAMLKEKYSGLTIAGADDKLGYKKVRDAWSEVRTTRTGLEKKGLELRNGYGIITKGIKTEQDRLVELITPLEEALYTNWKAIDEEKDRIDREKREAEEREAMARVEEVLGLGMVFRDGFYVVGESMSMDVATLRAMPLDQFEKLKAGIVAKVAEMAKIEAEAAAERLRQAEQWQRDRDELAHQQEEMRKEREEMQRQKDELAQAQREAAKQRIENRIGKLTSLGFKKREFDVAFDNGFSFGVSIPILNFSGISEDEFANLLQQMEEEIKKLNIEKSNHEEQVNQEKAAKAKKEKFISEKMVEAGMVYSYSHGEFQFSNQVTIFSAGWDSLLSKTEDEIVVIAQEFARVISEAKVAETKAKKEREEAAAKEDDAAKSDKQRFSELISELEVLRLKLHPDKFKSATYKKQAGYVNKALIEIVNANK